MTTLAGCPGTALDHCDSSPDDTEAIRTLLDGFAPIALDDIGAATLQDRTDTKYVMTTSQVTGVLEALLGQYRVLDIAGVRLNRYQTNYFDTADFALFAAHHGGRGMRFKVRRRTYVETSTSYIEVKQKTPNDRTIKSRIRTIDSCTLLAPPEVSFVDGLLPIRHEFLETKLSNGFHRITLVNESCQERLTIDLNLSFHSEAESIHLPNVVVAELKQPRASRGSAFSHAVREQGVRPSRFSKYCVGVSLLYPMVKHNNFKPELRLIDRLMGGN